MLAFIFWYLIFGLITASVCDIFMEKRPETFNNKDRKIVAWSLLFGWPIFYLLAILIGAALLLNLIINGKK